MRLNTETTCHLRVRYWQRRYLDQKTAAAQRATLSRGEPEAETLPHAATSYDNKDPSQLKDILLQRDNEISILLFFYLSKYFYSCVSNLFFVSEVREDFRISSYFSVNIRSYVQ